MRRISPQFGSPFLLFTFWYYGIQPVVVLVRPFFFGIVDFGTCAKSLRPLALTESAGSLEAFHGLPRVVVDISSTAPSSNRVVSAFRERCPVCVPVCVVIVHEYCVRIIDSSSSYEGKSLLLIASNYSGQWVSAAAVNFHYSRRPATQGKLVLRVHVRRPGWASSGTRGGLAVGCLGRPRALVVVLLSLIARAQAKVHRTFMSQSPGSL